MKRWIAVGILMLLLVISIGTCSVNSTEVDRVKEELAGARAELADARVELADITGELEKVSSSLAQFKATKEITFGNGLRVFDIEKGYYEVRGKIQNVSSEPMQKVVVLVTFYNNDGQLDEDWGSVSTYTVQDLFVGEVAEWKVDFGNWTDHELGLFDVYAIGNRSG